MEKKITCQRMLVVTITDFDNGDSQFGSISTMSESEMLEALKYVKEALENKES